MIAVPTRGWIHYKVVAVLGQLQGLGFPSFLSQSSYGVEAARGRLANFFIKFKEHDSLLFLDDDMMPPMDIVARLAHDDRDIVSASYPILKGDTIYDSSARWDKDHYDTARYEETGLQEVDAVGLGCCLIKRPVIEACMKYRCFSMELDDDYEVTKGEDYRFCEIAKKIGYKIFVDFDVKCKHLKTMPLKGGDE